MSHVRIVKSEDWVEVFVDGKSFTEGHHYDTAALLQHLGHTVESEYVDRCPYCEGVFPEGSLKGGPCERCRAKFGE